MKKKPKPVTLPPRRARNVTAAKAVNQKAGPFRRKPRKVAEDDELPLDEIGPGVFVWRDCDLPGGL